MISVRASVCVCLCSLYILTLQKLSNKLSNRMNCLLKSIPGIDCEGLKADRAQSPDWIPVHVDVAWLDYLFLSTFSLGKVILPFGGFLLISFRTKLKGQRLHPDTNGYGYTHLTNSLGVRVVWKSLP